MSTFCEKRFSDGIAKENNKKRQNREILNRFPDMSSKMVVTVPDSEE